MSYKLLIPTPKVRTKRWHRRLFAPVIDYAACYPGYKMIHCGVCGRLKTADVEFMCAHCINGSPSILLRDRFKLLAIRDEVRQLKEEVGAQLESGFAGEGELGRQLQKLDVFNERRRLIKLRQKIRIASKRLEMKKTQYHELETQLEYARDVSDTHEPGDTISMAEQIRSEEKGSLGALSHILERNQVRLFDELCRWFRIQKCSEDQTGLFPYTIWGVQMANLKYSNELDPHDLLQSMIYLQKFIDLSFRIWLFKGASKPLIQDTTNTIQNYAQLIHDVLNLLQARRLVSESVSIRDVLMRYDLDEMVYHLSQNTFLTSLDDASNSYPPTLQNIKQLVASMIPSV